MVWLFLFLLSWAKAQESLSLDGPGVIFNLHDDAMRLDIVETYGSHQYTLDWTSFSMGLSNETAWNVTRELTGNKYSLIFIKGFDTNPSDQAMQLSARLAVDNFLNVTSVLVQLECFTIGNQVDRAKLFPGSETVAFLPASLYCDARLILDSVPLTPMDMEMAFRIQAIQDESVLPWVHLPTGTLPLNDSGTLYTFPNDSVIEFTTEPRLDAQGSAGYAINLFATEAVIDGAVQPLTNMIYETRWSSGAPLPDDPFDVIAHVRVRFSHVNASVAYAFFTEVAPAIVSVEQSSNLVGMAIVSFLLVVTALALFVCTCRFMTRCRRSCVGRYAGCAQGGLFYNACTCWCCCRQEYIGVPYRALGAEDEEGQDITLVTANEFAEHEVTQKESHAPFCA